MSKRFAAPDDDKERMIHHGLMNHSLLDAKLGKCEFCNKVSEEFKRFKETKEFFNILEYIN